jgi:hypothetical protein
MVPGPIRSRHAVAEMLLTRNKFVKDKNIELDDISCRGAADTATIKSCVTMKRRGMPFSSAMSGLRGGAADSCVR